MNVKGKIKGIYYKEFLYALNELIDAHYHTVTVKKIRQIMNIHNSNKSKINFIWRFLDFLREQNLLIIMEKKPRQYLLPKERIEFDQINE